NLNKELESCSNTLVSSTNSLRLDTGRRVFFFPDDETTDSTGGSGVGGVRFLALVFAGAWRLAAGLPERVAGVSTSGASGVMSEEAETMVPMRVGNFGSGIEGVLLFVKVARR